MSLKKSTFEYKTLTLILEQVSHNLLYWKNRPTDICDIQARPEIWKTVGKNAKLKEQKWSNEKIHLGNARKLRGIYFIDPEDKEFKETIKNARKKLETSVAPAMPCKIMKKNVGVVDPTELKQDLRVFWKLMNLQDCVWENHFQIIMKTILQEKRQFITALQLGLQIYSHHTTSGGTLCCIFGSHKFVPISWMCKKQTSVSHSSTESEIISLNTGLSLDGIPALDLRDLIVSVLGNVSRFR